MKAIISKVLLLAVVAASLAGVAFAQFGSVRGTCRDAQGAPITNAEIVWKNQNNGRVYKLTTDKKKGTFFSLGVEPGDYLVTLTKDGQKLDEQKNVHVSLDELVYDIDLKKIQQESVAETAKKEGKSTSEVTQQAKQQQAEVAKVKAYNESVKAVNEKLAAGKDLLEAKNYPQAIAAFQDATTALPDNDIVWYRLGNAYMISAAAQTDSEERKKQYLDAFNDLQKAVDLKKATPPQTDAAKEEKNKRDLAVYYDNLGAAAGRLSKLDDATKAYDEAVKLDPANAARYYFNFAVVLHNNAMDADTKRKAADTFDKVITADPTKADAYFFKGSDLIALSTTQGDKMVAPPGTAEAFQKYLELQPAGPHAEEAKQMLAALNATVESSYGGKKGAPTKKK